MKAALLHCDLKANLLIGLVVGRCDRELENRFPGRDPATLYDALMLSTDLAIVRNLGRVDLLRLVQSEPETSRESRFTSTGTRAGSRARSRSTAVP